MGAVFLQSVVPSKNIVPFLGIHSVETLGSKWFVFVCSSVGQSMSRAFSSYCIFHVASNVTDGHFALF